MCCLAEGRFPSDADPPFPPNKKEADAAAAAAARNDDDVELSFNPPPEGDRADEDSFPCLFPEEEFESLDPRWCCA